MRAISKELMELAQAAPELTAADLAADRSEMEAEFAALGEAMPELITAGDSTEEITRKLAVNFTFAAKAWLWDDSRKT